MRTHGDFFRHIYAESNETQRVLVEDRYAHTTEALLGCTKNTHSPNIMNDGFQGPYLVYIDVDTSLCPFDPTHVSFDVAVHFSRDEIVDAAGTRSTSVS